MKPDDMDTHGTKKIKVPLLKKGRRRRFSNEEKRLLLTEAFIENESVSEVGRRYGIAIGLLFRWQRQLGVTRASVCGQAPRMSTVEPSSTRLSEIEQKLEALLNHNQALQERLARIESGNSTNGEVELATRPS